MAYQTILPKALAARGLTVETVPGWESRGSSAFSPGGAVCHWTAGPAGTIKRPSLNVVINGRPGLPGPLCNVYLDRYGVAVVVAAGRANHAGTGGWRGLSGNSAVFGTEAESAGPDDWTAAQRAAYPRINAAFCDVGGFGADMVCGHSEWAGPRKTDINGYTTTAMRAAVAAILAGNPNATVEDDLSAEAEKLIGEMHWMLGQIKPNADRIVGVQKSVDELHWGVLDGEQGVRTQLAAIFARLSQGAGTGITPADIAAMIPSDFAEAVADELHNRLAG